MAQQEIYKVIFSNQGEIFEIFARSVSQGGLFGFVEVEQLLFGERSALVVDPTEDKLKNEFRDVKRTYIPLHAVVRIDQVEKQGQSRITGKQKKGEGTLPFPTPIYDKPGTEPTKPFKP